MQLFPITYLLYNKPLLVKSAILKFLIFSQQAVETCVKFTQGVGVTGLIEALQVSVFTPSVFVVW